MIKMFAEALLGLKAPQASCWCQLAQSTLSTQKFVKIDHAKAAYSAACHGNLLPTDRRGKSIFTMQIIQILNISILSYQVIWFSAS